MKKEKNRRMQMTLLTARQQIMEFARNSDGTADRQSFTTYPAPAQMHAMQFHDHHQDIWGTE